MQVSTRNDHVTHAVIGGNALIEARISDKADFFTLLSSTLYSNQKLAVVREVICNAWDAHIAAGKTDTPIEITATKEHFIVQDLGLGIHHDNIGAIYLSYGDSTKANDGKQTGGFGLGCKAPFAYNDHFEVISSHEGTATIYAMSRSSAKANGKPGATPITSFPKEQSGLSVKVPLLPGTDDWKHFLSLAKQIVYQGDMKANINGDVAKNMGFENPAWYNLATSESSSLRPSEKISLRYGNVIYPIPEANTAIATEYMDVVRVLKQAHGYDLRVVLQAPPHSISVTPSRESLSMVDRTIDTVKALLVAFRKEWDKEFIATYKERALEYAEEAAKLGYWGTLFDRHNIMPRAPKSALPAIAYSGYMSPAVCNSSNSIAEFCRAWVCHVYPAAKEFSVFDLASRAQIAHNHGFIPRGLAHTFAEALEGIDPRSRRTPFEWFSRRITGPLLKKLYNSSNEYLSPVNLRVTGPTSLYVSGGSNYTSDASTPAKQAQIRKAADAVLFLRQIVFISYTVSGFHERAYEMMDSKLGDPAGCFLYRVAKKKEAVDAAKAFFTKLGYHVIDLTVETPSELADRTKREALQKTNPVPVVEKVKVPKKKGYPCASNCYEGGQRIYVYKAFRDDADFIEKPEWYVKKSSEYEVDAVLDMYSTSELFRQFGDKGCVIRDKRHEAKLIASGVMRGDDYLKKQVTEALKKRTDLIPHLASNVEANIHKDAENHRELKVLQNIPEFAKKHGIAPLPLSKETANLYRVFQNLSRPASARTTEQLGYATLLESIPLKQEIIDMDKKITKSTLFQFFDFNRLWSNEELLKTDKTLNARVMALLNHAINR